RAEQYYKNMGNTYAAEDKTTELFSGDRPKDRKKSTTGNSGQRPTQTPPTGTPPKPAVIDASSLKASVDNPQINNNYLNDWFGGYTGAITEIIDNGFIDSFFKRTI